MTVICQDCGHIDDTMRVLPTPRTAVGKVRGIASTDGRMTCRKCNSENLVNYRDEESG